LVSYFSGKSLKLLPPDALVLAQNTPKCVWRPGYARTRWGSLSAPPDPLATKGGLLLRGGEGRRGWEGREGFCRTNQNMAATALLYHLLPAERHVGYDLRERGHSHELIDSS